MPYKWPKNLIDRDGVPYEKKPPVYLEKTDEDGNVVASDTFLTQDSVDDAWINGYHTPGKPETRDVGEVVETIPEDLPDDRYECDLCDFSTTYKPALKAHNTRYHK